jgi:hypothetical protein
MTSLVGRPPTSPVALKEDRAEAPEGDQTGAAVSFPTRIRESQGEGTDEHGAREDNRCSHCSRVSGATELVNEEVA